MIWDATTKDEYPSVRVFANKMKLALMDAHDAIMKARVKQTVGANKKRRVCPLVKGDLVYISKFIGPYRISDDFGNNSFRVELPDNEWAVDRIIRHRGSHADAMFEVQWTAGDRTWLPYDEIAHLKALADYFEVIGVDGIKDLKGTGDGGASDDDSQVFLGHLAPHIGTPDRQDQFPLVIATDLLNPALVLLVHPTVVARHRTVPPVLTPPRAIHIVTSDNPRRALHDPVHGAHHRWLIFVSPAGIRTNIQTDGRHVGDPPKPL